jgi:hypothetical protein
MNDYIVNYKGEEGTFVVNQGMNTHNNGPMKVFIYVYMYIHT